MSDDQNTSAGGAKAAGPWDNVQPLCPPGTVLMRAPGPRAEYYCGDQTAPPKKPWQPPLRKPNPEAPSRMRAEVAAADPRTYLGLSEGAQPLMRAKVSPYANRWGGWYSRTSR